MIRINLLPYRTQRRQTKILQHLVAACAVIFVAVSLVFVADLVKSSELTELEDTFGELKAQNAALQKRIGKIKDLDNLRADVERKLELVEELQQGRFHTLVTLNKLSTVIPENVWLKSIADSGGKISLTGLGESNKAVANFMRALDQEAVFSNISLSTIARTNMKNVPVRSFSLTMNRVTEEVQKKAKESGK
ncbi:PilN domain-containing protein [Pseudomonadota bacterium]